jgi:CubicO group peptidase (beta-lactamase class C family)
VRFGAALTDGRLVSMAMLKRLTEPQSGTGGSLGFQIGGAGTAGYFGHGGGAPGMNSMLRIFPALGYTVVVLSNYDSGANLAGAYVTEVLR